MLSTTHFQMSYDDFYGNRSEVVQDILANSQFLDVTIVNEEREWGTDSVLSKSRAKEDPEQREPDAVPRLSSWNEILNH